MSDFAPRPQSFWFAARPPLALAGSLCLAATLVAVAFVTFAPIVQLGGAWGVWPETWRYADSGLPVLLTADGYYFLSEAGRAGLTGASTQTPALSLLALVAARLSGASLEAVAFYLPLFFSLTLGFLTLAWSRLAGAGIGPSALAALATALIPAWVDRGGPGMFDTDMVIVFLWQLELLGLVLAGRPGWSLRARGLAGGGALVAWLLLSWFWKPGLFLGLASLIAWVIFFLPPSRFWSYKLRTALTIAAVAWGGSILLLPSALAPAPTALANYASDLFSLAFGLRSDLFYSAIAELQPLAPAKWLEFIGGTAGGGLLILAAAAVLFVTTPSSRLPLALGLICLAAGLRANRFAYLGAFQLALSLGLLPHTLPQVTARFRPGWAALARPLGLLLVLGLIASCGYWAYHRGRDFEPRWKIGDDRLALALGQAASPEARLWNWWDDGYFLAARAGREPLFHGGSQTSTVAYIAAHPFLMEDRAAAARWMRFFALRGEAGLAPLIQAWGPNKAWEKLEALLNLPDPGQAEAADLAKLPGGVEWLLPPGQVFFFLPRSLISTSGWWTTVGASRVPDPALLRRHIEAVARAEFKYVPQTNELYLSQDLLDRGYSQFGEVWNTRIKPLAPPWPQTRPPYLVFSEENDYYGYIVDQWGLKSLPVALLTPGGVELDKFNPVAIDYEWGGVWEVLP